MMPGFTPHQVPGFAGFAHPDDMQAVTTTAVFLETEPERPISMAAQLIKDAAEKPAATVKVKVVPPFRVVWQGKPYVGGDVLEVPNDDEHKAWIRARWVEPVKEK